MLTAFWVVACQSDEENAMPPAETNSTNGENKTLIVYYSYTNNTEQIVDDLKTMINADVIEVEPVNKNLDYAANNYAIGTEQLNKIKNNPNDEGSYPEIEISFPYGAPEGWESNGHSPFTGELEGVRKYNTVIIATPLWWSQMASNMQTFLFKYGNEMAGKNIGLIVSSHSSGISGVEADAKRLVSNGKFYAKSLWINAPSSTRRFTFDSRRIAPVTYCPLGTRTTPPPFLEHTAIALFTAFWFLAALAPSDAPYLVTSYTLSLNSGA